MHAACSFLLLTLLSFSSFGGLPPNIYGSVYQLSPADTEKAVAVAREDLARSVPAYHIFRVWIQSADEVRPYYRSGDGPARHLVVKRIRGKWRVTARPQSIDSIDRDRDDIIITP